MRELVFVCELVHELSKKMEYDLKSVSQVSNAWKYNIGAQIVGNSKGLLISSWKKNIGIKYHWFRSKIIPNKLKSI